MGYINVYIREYQHPPQSDTESEKRQICLQDLNKTKIGLGLKGTQYSENVLPQTFRLDTCVYTQSHFLTSFADIYCCGSTQLEHALGRSKVPSWHGAIKQAQCQPWCHRRLGNHFLMSSLQSFLSAHHTHQSPLPQSRPHLVITKCSSKCSLFKVIT